MFGMAREPFSVRQEDLSPGVKLVVVRGDIGYSEAPAFGAALKQVQTVSVKSVLIDLTGVEFMNTPGLATLVQALQSTKKTGGKLVLFGLQEKVRAVFEIAKLNKVFVIAVTRQDAERV
jgi:anti-sigma B factor antagonist